MELGVLKTEDAYEDEEVAQADLDPEALESDEEDTENRMLGIDTEESDGMSARYAIAHALICF